MKVKETVFNNRINTHSIKHTSSGFDTVWAGIDHMVLDLISLDGGSDVQIDTTTEPTAIDFSVNGVLTFLLGDKGVAIGSYQVQLVAVDGSDEKTQIIHSDKDYVVFNFSATKTVT